MLENHDTLIERVKREVQGLFASEKIQNLFVDSLKNSIRNEDQNSSGRDPNSRSRTVSDNSIKPSYNIRKRPRNSGTRALSSQPPKWLLAQARTCKRRRISGPWKPPLSSRVPPRIRSGYRSSPEKHLSSPPPRHLSQQHRDPSPHRILTITTKESQKTSKSKDTLKPTNFSPKITSSQVTLTISKNPNRRPTRISIFSEM